MFGVHVCMIETASLAAAALGLALALSASAAAPAGNAKMKMNEPMAGEMKKEGMKKGDVKEHAQKWDRKMKAMMEEEEKQKRGERAKK